MSNYLTPKEILIQFGITRPRLKYYRIKGYLKNIIWSPGKEGPAGKGRPYYHVDELKSVFGQLKA